MSLYRDPRHAITRDYGIVAALTRTPATRYVLPDENQFSEALCWALRRVPGLARDFARTFIAGNPVAEAALASATQLGVETRVTGTLSDGSVVYPDISICGEDRTFQLLVEVKTGSGFVDCRLPDGRVVSQPLYYVEAFEHEPADRRARVGLVGTLTVDPATAPSDAHPRRCRDISWMQVRDLLLGCTPPDGYALVVAEIAEAITNRLSHAQPTYESAAALLRWADTLLPGLLRRVATAIDGSTSGQVHQGRAYVYRGGTVRWTTVDGAEATMWVYVSPQGGGRSVPGEPDAVYIQPDEGKAALKDPMLGHRLSQGFTWERSVAGWERWHLWIPAAAVQAAGDHEAQVDLVVARVTDALAAGEALGPAGGRRS